jgi:uncharacterized protein YndB with AHSA1/START domain
MDTFLLILGIIVILLAALFGYAAAKPNTFRVQRSATIQSPPERIFALINDFHQFGFWSPWEKIDPNLQRTFSGAASGPGAVYEWEGNKKVGKGRMEIKETTPPSKIVIQLDFLKPFEAHNTTEFTLEPQGNSTNVTWAMFGRQPFMFKVMSTLFNMDKMIGRDFEKGLANLKSVTEK